MMRDFLKKKQPITGFNQEEDKLRWREIQKFLDTYLNRVVTNEIASKTLLEVFSSLVEDLFFMTRDANCNCVNHDRYEELNTEAEKLAQLAKLLGKDLSGYLK